MPKCGIIYEKEYNSLGIKEAEDQTPQEEEEQPEEQQQDDDQGHRNDHRQLCLCPLHVFELPGPTDRISRRQFHILGQSLLGFLNIAPDIDPIDIDINPAIGTGIFAADHTRAIGDRDISNPPQRNLGTGRRDHRQIPDRVRDDSRPSVPYFLFHFSFQKPRCNRKEKPGKIPG